MRQKTCFSVVEMRSENVAFVSENEGSDLGIPWPDGPPSSDCPVVWHADGPPSSDCPVGWHADDAPRRTQVRGRGSRPVLAQNQGVRVPIPAGAFYAPQNTSQGFSVAINSDFVRKPRECVSPFPQGLFPPPKTRPRVFCVAKMLFW